jgi:hypothetical protein
MSTFLPRRLNCLHYSPSDGASGGILTVTPQVLGLQSALVLHEPKHHLFICEHGTYVMH